jgi:hypothetical protein
LKEIRMKTSYVLLRPANIDGKEYPAGTVLGSIETVDNVEPDKLIHAIRTGHAVLSDGADAKAVVEGSAPAAPPAAKPTPAAKTKAPPTQMVEKADGGK